nr:hypothetical protein [Cryobacterium breve]
MTFGDTVDAGEAASILDAALDAGITVIDTANGYAGARARKSWHPCCPSGAPRWCWLPKPACRIRMPATIRRCRPLACGVR